jgi:hypothetical protein
MAVEVTEIHVGWRTVIATKPTFAEAKAYVESLGVSYMEDDADHTDCADALLNDGRLLAIQPVGFKL